MKHSHLVRTSPLKIFLIRHGETDWNRAGKFQGHTDVPLNDLGREQAERLQSLVRGAELEAFWTSDLLRAHDTAQIAVKSSKHALPIVVDHRLRECHLGAAEGLTELEQRATFGNDFIDGWRKLSAPEHWDLKFPGGESSSEVVERVLLIFDEIQRRGYSCVGITTHGGVIRRVLKHLKLEPEEYFLISNTLTFQLDQTSAGYALATSLPWKNHRQRADHSDAESP